MPHVLYRSRRWQPQEKKELANRLNYETQPLFLRETNPDLDSKSKSENNKKRQRENRQPPWEMMICSPAAGWRAVSGGGAASQPDTICAHHLPQHTALSQTAPAPIQSSIDCAVGSGGTEHLQAAARE
ncbi:predicted protein [Histoplasma capsulatum G186AR]|uniref:Uncharacterized protein n=2 Tax=Ajellomyces capsulatus TaxID=5037 RepID=C0NH75_AJECG|nr:uncharacterized protein HCBG_02697 [Histoplasma capsulatum G186AR]EEH09160.1 predicted protein [Histoplasma capsulatum G186AR]KAG5303513.1 hypothetical protein I7I52_01530 [Histoplasma capsulatum]QSS69110.1 hypothetical protein I7I50_10291 [Histoplasma capsulatum G186AR]